jgi:hypothetical protein
MQRETYEVLIAVRQKLLTLKNVFLLRLDMREFGLLYVTYTSI